MLKKNQLSLLHLSGLTKRPRCLRISDDVVDVGHTTEVDRQPRVGFGQGCSDAVIKYSIAIRDAVRCSTGVEVFDADEYVEAIRGRLKGGLSERQVCV